MLLRMRAPGSVRILDPHVEHAAVTVDVLDLQSVLRLVARIGPDAGADEPPLLQPALRTVGIQARDDIEDARVEHSGDLVVLSVLRQ